MGSAKYNVAHSIFTGQTAVGDHVRQDIGVSVFSGQEIAARGELGAELARLLNDLRNGAEQSPALTAEDRQEVQSAVTGLAGELARVPVERDQKRLAELTTRIAAICRTTAPLIDLVHSITNLIGH
jgi:hypothetical protein